MSRSRVAAVMIGVAIVAGCGTASSKSSPGSGPDTESSTSIENTTSTVGGPTTTLAHDDFGFSIISVCAPPGDVIELWLDNNTSEIGWHSWWGLLQSVTGGDIYQVYLDPASALLIPAVKGTETTILTPVAPGVEPGESVKLALPTPAVPDEYELLVYQSGPAFHLDVTVSTTCT